LVAGSAAQRRLDARLESCRERKWLKARGRQRTDATPVLARVRAVNRFECGGETLRHPLNTLALVAPAWLHTQSQGEGEKRYGPRVADDRWPTRTEDRHASAPVIGAEGSAVWSEIDPSPAPAWLREVPAVET
jgi:transposase